MSVYIETFEDLPLIDHHMVADRSEELHELALKFGLSECVNDGAKDSLPLYLVPKAMVSEVMAHGAIAVSQEQYRAMRFRYGVSGKFGNVEEAVDWMTQYEEARYRRFGIPYRGMREQHISGNRIASVQEVQSALDGRKYPPEGSDDELGSRG